MKKQFLPAATQNGPDGGAPRAARAGNLIFVGGQMSLDEQGRIVGSDVATQARNAFESLKRTLEDAGASLTDLVKHNVYFNCDGNEATVTKFMDELDRVRLDYFSYPGPTTTEVRVGLGREGASILVDGWAVVGGEKTQLCPAGHWRWEKDLPFAHGWKVGDMVFVGGQRSLDQNGQLLGAGDIEVQTDNAFRNLDTLLREAGGDRNSLMRQSTYYRFFG